MRKYPGTLAQLTEKPKPPPKPSYPTGNIGKQRRGKNG